MIRISNRGRLPVLAGLLLVCAVVFQTGRDVARARVSAASHRKSALSGRVASSYGKLPLYFEPNKGQTDASVRFLTRARGMTAYFTENETVMVVGTKQKSVVRMKLENAGKPRRVAGVEPESGVSNYFIGNDHSKWRTNVPHYGRVEYQGVYPGIDLVWYGNQRQMEYDFVLAPGADARRIQMDYEGVDSLRVDGNGELVLHTAHGEMRQQKPVVYQQIKGQRVEVPTRYAVSGSRVSFEVASYDRKRELRIDPVVLLYSTYLGGSDGDYATGIAVDSTGAAYIVGSTSSGDFPTQSAYQGTLKGEETVFVTKLAAAGNALVYSTFLGGSNYDIGNSIAVDSSGSAYVTGATMSSDFPTQSAFQSTLNSTDGESFNAFVTKLSPAGNALVYSTYLGGNGGPSEGSGSSGDMGAGIAVDSTGAAYVAGSTASTNFPTKTPIQATLNGYTNAFVTKLAAAGSSLVYSTYLGGSNSDSAYGIALDGTGAAYIVGETYSSDFPTLSAYQASPGSDNVTAFVSKLTPAGTALSYSTYLGGTGGDYGYGIAVDSSGAAYVTGETYSVDFPTVSAFQSTLNSSYNGNAFVTKLAPPGNSLVYSTYLGGSYENEGGGDYGEAIAVDSTGAAYVTGAAYSSDFPIQSAYQSTQDGYRNAFVTKFMPAGSTLAYSTFLGGTGGDYGNGIALDSAGSAYIAGGTSSSDFPTQGPYQAALNGYQNAFVAKLSGPLTITTTSLPVGILGVAYSTTVAANGGTLPYNTWTATGLPNGLTLNPSTGVLSGTPTQTGTFTVNISVNDSTSPVQNASQSYSLLVNSVNPGPVTVSCVTTTNPVAPGSAYSATCSLGGVNDTENTIAFFESGMPSWLTVTPLDTSPASVGLSGTAPGPGGTSYLFSVGVTYCYEEEGCGYSASTPISINVLLPLTITNGSLPAGTIGGTYSTSLSASGGVTPYNSWAATGLPPGLSINPSTGLLSGTPSESGTFVVTISVKDSTSPAETASHVYSLLISASQLLVSQASLPQGYVGVFYNAPLQAGGGTTPYHWTVISGLPPGLALSNNSITGTPTTAGTYSVSVEATDNSTPAQVAYGTLSLLISPPPAQVTCGATSGAYPAGSQFSIVCTATGGVLPYKFSFSPSLPSWLTSTQTSSSTITISGTVPAAPPSSYVETVTLTDSTTPTPGTNSTKFTISVTAAKLTLSCMPSTGNYAPGASFTSTCTVTGGTEPYNWSVTPSLSWLQSTPASGASSITISGTIPATAPASYSENVSVTDSTTPGAQSASTTVAISVSGSTLTANCSPSSGAYAPGQAYSTTCTAAGGISPYNWKFANLPSWVVAPTSTTGPSITLSGTVPAALTSYNFSTSVSDSSSPTPQSVTVPLAVTVTSTMTISCTLPASVIAGSQFTGSCNATGGTSPYSWKFSNLPSWITSPTATGASITLSGTAPSPPPASYSFGITANDSTAPTAQSATFNATVAINPVPVNATVTQSTSNALPNQSSIAIVLGQSASSNLTGTLSLSFQISPNVMGVAAPYMDPSAGFPVTGSSQTALSTSVNVPSGSAQSSVQFAQGTVAGTWTVTLSSLTDGNGLSVLPNPAPTTTVVVAPAAPTITAGSVVITGVTSTGFVVQLSGTSNTRSVTSATFQFAPASGTTLEGSTVTVPFNGADQTQWFGTPASDPYGGTFSLSVPFAFSGSTSALGTVTVTLTNSVGTSAPVTGSQ